MSPTAIQNVRPFETARRPSLVLQLFGIAAKLAFGSAYMPQVDFHRSVPIENELRACPVQLLCEARLLHAEYLSLIHI